MKQIDPEPKEDINGDINYVTSCCEGVCYQMSKHGMCISKCLNLEVGIMSGLKCKKWGNKEMALW